MNEHSYLLQALLHPFLQHETEPTMVDATVIAPGGRGGSAARRALRRAGPKTGAVRPGLPGGTYRPLSERDMQRVHETALDVLEQLGVGDPIPEILEVALPRGAFLNARGRLCFPRSLVEDVLAGACRSYVAYGVAPEHDLEIGGNRVNFATAGEAIKVLDFQSGEYRPSTLLDLYDFARLADRLEHVHCFGQTVVATDMPDRLTSDFNVAYACLAGTRKSFGVSIENVEHHAKLIGFFDAFLGGEGRFVERPFCVIGGCPIVSPLRFGKENAEVMVANARLGLGIDPAIAAQAGATAPAALAGTLVQTVAETLVPLIVGNLIRPGLPVSFGIWPFVSDLRTGAFTGGGGEEALLTAAAVQMCRFYDLPSSVGAGMTDAKAIDAQAGYEKGVTVTLAAVAGGNYVSECCGMMASLIGCSVEAMVIDNDMLGNIQRVLKGIEVTEETLSFDEIARVIDGPGHYLGSPETLARMETEYLYPHIADRDSMNGWQGRGAPDIRQAARKRAQEILSTHYPSYIDPVTDAKLRERYPIRLSPADMRADSGRW
jgi:trimethylamine--corrinoid protein Co-methyltransferase